MGPDPRRGAADEAEAIDEDLDGLALRGDADGLLALARAYRAGTLAGGRDMARCLAAYRAAAALGNADGEYAVALFAMTGSVVAQDLREGTTRLRTAAERGSLPAKVYLGNLYEAGIHYKADAEKADVWYRNAARAAKIDPAEPDYEAQMAELGCSRYVLARIASGELGEDDKARLLARARAHGHGLRVRDGTEGERPTLEAGLDARAVVPTPTPAGAGPTKTPRPTPSAPKAGPEAPVAKARTATAPKTAGLAAFGYALLFAATGVGAGFAATAFARELVLRGATIPGLGTRIDLVLPIVVAAIGVLPSALVYRAGAVVKALLLAAGLGGVGWVAWGAGVVIADRIVQSVAFGVSGFLAALLVLGLLGGAKTRRAPGRL